MSKPNILVVEDDFKSRKLLRDVLTAVGYEISEAENGEDGVRMAQESLPALILMDIRMPGMNGIEALHALREDAKTSTIPVIAVTASVMESQKAEAIGAGFNAIESKPVNIQSLLAVIRKFIEHNPLSETT